MTEALSNTHRETYDSLAQEYEQRVPASIDVISKAMDFFTPHIRPYGTVIDIGCGVGASVYLLSRQGFRVTGIELSPKMAEYARKRNPTQLIHVVDFWKFDCTDLFDAAVVFAFIHLFPKSNAPKVLARIRAFLKPGGVAIVSTTVSSIEWEGWEIKTDYKKREHRFRSYWTKDALVTELVNSGFYILAVKYLSDPFGKTWLDLIVERQN